MYGGQRGLIKQPAKSFDETKPEEVPEGYSGKPEHFSAKEVYLITNTFLKYGTKPSEVLLLAIANPFSPWQKAKQKGIWEKVDPEDMREFFKQN